MLFYQINNTATKTVTKEILRRDFVSRIYYTAFLHCSRTIDFKDTNAADQGSHNKVLGALNKDVKLDMVHLKRLRTNADYVLDAFPDPLKFKSKEEKLLRLLVVVDDILGMSKKELSS